MDYYPYTDPGRWQAELAWLVDPQWTLPMKWSYVNHRSGIDQGKSASQRLTIIIIIRNLYSAIMLLGGYRGTGETGR